MKTVAIFNKWTETLFFRYIQLDMQMIDKVIGIDYKRMFSDKQPCILTVQHALVNA